MSKFNRNYRLGLNGICIGPGGLACKRFYIAKTHEFLGGYRMKNLLFFFSKPIKPPLIVIFCIQSRIGWHIISLHAEHDEKYDVRDS
jgi:hypothetical protein